MKMITLEGRLTEINVKGKGASGVGSLKITHEAEDMRSRLGVLIKVLRGFYNNSPTIFKYTWLHTI